MQTRDVEKATSEHKDLTYLWNLPSAPSAFLRTAHSSSSVCCGRRPRQAGLPIQEAHKRNDWPDIITQLNHDDHHRKLIDKKRGLEKAHRNVLKAIEAHYAPELAERLRTIAAEKAAIEREIAAYKNIVAATSTTSHKRLSNQLGKYLKTADDLEAKDFITSMVKEILVSNEDISIKLNIA